MISILWGIPLLGSCVLLASGVVITLGHHANILSYPLERIISIIDLVMIGLMVSVYLIF